MQVGFQGTTRLEARQERVKEQVVSEDMEVAGPSLVKTAALKGKVWMSSQWWSTAEQEDRKKRQDLVISLEQGSGQEMLIMPPLSVLSTVPC